MYNNSAYSTTGYSPFYAIYRFHPLIDENINETPLIGDSPTAEERVQQLV
jgi:hypothetical protein